MKRYVTKRLIILLMFLTLIIGCNLNQLEDPVVSFEEISQPYIEEYGAADVQYELNNGSGHRIMLEWEKQFRVQFVATGVNGEESWSVEKTQIYHSLKSITSSYEKCYGESVIVGRDDVSTSYKIIYYDFSASRFGLTVLYDGYSEVWGWEVLYEDLY